ncbi:alpha-amylase [Phycisphaera mikurensis]|uniref:Putative alpha-amylase n=1 Tax=Phycisphaera mikurensis (strain NBRC 102666 / KCTC 22515 / FYK2301M01) TaxID=1142394 RepID=I0IAJ9_PHYMF|nr:alpha-amylase [Phycisphaera mikurensis]MBB6441717.1 alpha-amylase [Phycisphaera mikurensis]BAM02287.1 putative alpha-amylase [Phycisphaera mikurensis NBRC 102666]
MSDNAPPSVMLQAFTWRTPADGGFWERLGKQGRHLAEIGFTHVWCPPPCKGGGGAADRGYGLYDLYDLGEFDQKGAVRTRYGTKEALVAAVAALKEAGLEPIADVVLNHRMGADEQESFEVQEVDPSNRLENIGEPFELTAWTGYTFPGRLREPGDPNDFRWRWHHFTAVDQAPEGDESDRPRLFRIADRGWEPEVDDENGNADFLMGCDVNLDQDDVRAELFRWGDWFLAETGFSGFRFDAAKHMSRRFLRDFLGHVRAPRGEDHPGGGHFAVSEYGSGDPAAIRAFLDATGGATQAFDFPLHYAFAAAGAAMNGQGELDLRGLFDGAVVQTHPDLAVTFVDNHDSDPAQEVGGWVDDAFKPHAYAAILLRAGGMPCVFGGDLDFLRGGVGLPGNEGDAAPDCPPLTDHGVVIRRLMDARRGFAFGEQEEVAVEAGHRAWIRRGTDAHPGVMVVVINAGDDDVTIEADTRRGGQLFRELVRPDAGEEVTAGDDGTAALRCPARDVAVWVC